MNPPKCLNSTQNVRDKWTSRWKRKRQTNEHMMSIHYTIIIVPGPFFTNKTPSYQYRIPIINLRRSSDRLRFIMGIPIPVGNRGPGYKFGKLNQNIKENTEKEQHISERTVELRYCASSSTHISFNSLFKINKGGICLAQIVFYA